MPERRCARLRTSSLTNVIHFRGLAGCDGESADEDEEGLADTDGEGSWGADGGAVDDGDRLDEEDEDEDELF